ncbi:hypothetical protein L2E82_03221 [Cichorium intybus]|uniref:Uncharacterized protein n=1 Tax=Cichorium intybus TaxID=13427 RepID=A0ACB9H4L0_CICIN|nr:hypothetical protein L2E82_03221 [Cichorium intybus]
MLSGNGNNNARKAKAIAKKVKGTTAVKDGAKLGDGGGGMVLSVGERELLPEGDWPEVGGDTGLASPEVGVGVGVGGAVVVEGAGDGVAVGGETGAGVAGAGVADPVETLMVNF